MTSTSTRIRTPTRKLRICMMHVYLQAVWCASVPSQTQQLPQFFRVMAPLHHDHRLGNTLTEPASHSPPSSSRLSLSLPDLQVSTIRWCALRRNVSKYLMPKEGAHLVQSASGEPGETRQVPSVTDLERVAQTIGSVS